jgi:hypothetical protein
VIFEVLIAVSVKIEVVLVVNTCRLIDTTSCLSTRKLEVVASYIFMVETEPVSSSEHL